MGKFRKMLKEGYIFLDGAMGTMLFEAGLKMGERPEEWSVLHPDQVTKIHKKYVEAGSQIIYTNTFGGNRHKLAGSECSVRDVVYASVACAKEAVKGSDALVALDIGPIGEFLEPSGTLTFEEAYDIFKEMAVYAEEAGCDLVVFETMTDLYELKAGVLAVKENTSLPLICTMTFEENARTFTGCSIEAMAAVLNGLDVDAMGINCSLGPKEILPLAKKLIGLTDKPIVVKANAGLPDPLTNLYDISAKEFACLMQEYAKAGIKILGGCCGTDPSYIYELRRAVENIEACKESMERKTTVCSPTRCIRVDGVRPVGERINPTGKKRFAQALREKDMSYIAARAIEQAQAGAQILDVNVGLPGIDEEEMMIKAVKTIQSVCDLPLQIDSSDPKAIEAGLRVFNGKAIVNSVNAEPERMRGIFPIVKKYGAAVIGLTIDEGGLPKTAKERIRIAKTILEEALSYGICKEDVIIDCLTLTVSAQQEQARETLDAVRYISQEMGLQTTLGVSNISFGLPARIQVTRNFLIQAMYCGLTLPIINPNQEEIMDAIASFRVLSGEDEDSRAFIERFANRGEAVAITLPDDEKKDLAYAVSQGLKEEAASMTEALLKQKSETEIIDEILIPALDRVGERFARQEIFLPQLIKAAEASCQAFEVLKSHILKGGDKSIVKDKVILATVKGDIHDIGKNIVKVMLENYSYQVIDLGRDVDPSLVVETAKKENVRLIGLSALMTTTLKSMKETVEALHESGHDCKIVVGGAVLTPEYAREIKADYYAKDAKQTVDFAKEVLG